jgi:glycosyltransferase involved in cell wall biosynthesis
MKIDIITPAPPRSQFGNRITALRWQRCLQILGHHVTISNEFTEAEPDALIALHARRSYPSIRKFHQDYPDKPLIVALTGTDLYRDLKNNVQAWSSLEMASHIVVLQPEALKELPTHLRRKTRIIYQSVDGSQQSAASSQPAPVSKEAVSQQPETVLGAVAMGSQPLTPNAELSIINYQPSTVYRVCVIGHLRAVKDPFRAAMAARLLPASSRIQITHIGGAMTEAMKKRAEREMKVNPRYQWIGEIPQNAMQQMLKSADLYVLSSRMEGGANVIGEAVTAGVPIIASRIPGNVGLLKKSYRGYFAVGDTHTLMQLMWRAETDENFRQQLQKQCAAVAWKFDPARELASWESLLAEIS